MPDNCGIPDPQTNEILLPPPINLNSEFVVPYGLYLIDDGQTQFIWLGKDAIPALTADVFGVEDKTQVRQGKTLMPELENEFNERVRAVIEKSRDHRAKGVGSIIVPPLYVVREDGEPSLKLWAQTLLVEDRADQGVSVQQFMGMLREKVCFPNADVPLILSSWPD
jgi:protein transport protein SEC24